LVERLSFSEVLSTDIDEVRNRIVVGVVGAPSLRPVITSLAQELGVPAEALIIEEDEQSIVGQQTLLDYLRPVPGGVRIGTAQDIYCTLGVNMQVLNYATWSFDGYRYFVSNSHCTPTFGSVDLFSVSQGYSNSYIGAEYLDPPLFQGHSGCPSGRYCRFSDIAVFRYTLPNDSVMLPWIARTPGQGNLTISNYVSDKTGRASGITTGNVTAKCQNRRQSNPDETDAFRTMLCQGLAAYWAQGGDSGAPVFTLQSGEYRHVGIHWGHTGTLGNFSPWSAGDITPTGGAWYLGSCC
jgi:hypothetical protein